jgi:glycosyltransferase involved in cell wall biosynthesis
MKLHFLCNDGSPLGVHYSDVNGENGRIGVGGAELAMLTMCKYWTDLGWDVTLYNNPTRDDGYINQKPIDAFQAGEDRDILIVFRSPNTRSYLAKGKKVWWSCDQHTVGDFAQFSKMVHETVCISPFHAEHFKNRYGIDRVNVIDIPVRLDDYTADVPKKKQAIFCSVPDRGLMQLAQAWATVQSLDPTIELVITSSWSLWNGGNVDSLLMPYRAKFAQWNNVRYLSAVKREELIRLQLESSIHSYPCVYDELFCISVAECSVAGAYPVTSSIGAIQTTNMGTVLGGHPNDIAWSALFAQEVVKHMNNPELPKMQKELQEKARKRFDINTIHEEWMKVFNE